MIDPQNEELISLDAAAQHQLLRVNGKPTTNDLIYRWATTGVRSRVLETLMIGGRRVTSVEALRRFIESPQTPDVRRRQLTREERHLAASARLQKHRLGQDRPR
jgi:hypothetical protein